MNHVFVIKDFVATKESAEHIMKNQIDVILSANTDINISAIKVFINGFTPEFYKNYETQIPVSFIPTLVSGKKKSTNKQTFAAFHNSVINGIAGDLQLKNTLIHIQDGTLDITNLPSERGNCQTRLGEFVNDLLEVMKLLDYPVWFNTASDKGNHKYGHYYTNVDFINFDETCIFDTIPICFMYSGNSNLDWIAINCEEYKNRKMPNLMMNGSYDYDFLSIKHLIAKFADYGHGYFDNMFVTTPTEVGAYFRNREFDKDFQPYDMTKYKENMDNYRNNMEEYKNLRVFNIHDVVSYVRNTILPKLSQSDKEKLLRFENSLMNRIG